MAWHSFSLFLSLIYFLPATNGPPNGPPNGHFKRQAYKILLFGFVWLPKMSIDCALSRKKGVQVSLACSTGFVNVRNKTFCMYPFFFVRLDILYGLL
ncbi:hypothetical protein CLU79DRAFT_776702 [Phycomyces nitens]|nr:hypothetical protein CLU79DRAFT_776702 [Phycomyces nitens]